MERQICLNLSIKKDSKTLIVILLDLCVDMVSNKINISVLAFFLLLNYINVLDIVKIRCIKIPDLLKLRIY